MLKTVLWINGRGGWILKGKGPFAGSVTAALFLRRFIKHARRFAHFDIFGWRPAPKPLGPKGGEVQAARAMFDLLQSELR